ncbi:MAG: DUF2779 domain-containing protein, partial [Candidatus Nanoarchaeia archaeon]|nr:DUF2779 domain-containing protein [Candidatus Nanoarchaeia archaeon]
EEGVYSLKDIPEDFKLTEKQEIQRECAVKNKPFVHKEKLKHFLKTLKYPLSFLDFETFSTAVPKFDGLKPYSQVCFQYSLHLIDKEGSEAKHFEFLYSGDSDPREEFIKKLKEDLKDSGSVIVYNESFEISRLKELALSFPSYKEWVEGVISRIVDLWVVFRGFIYYHPDQEGSASIKKVLPALTGKGYTDMDIAEGNTASVEFIRMAYGDCSEIERVKIRDGLLRYCCLDTLAEVMILEKLRGLI